MPNLVFRCVISSALYALANVALFEILPLLGIFNFGVFGTIMLFGLFVTTYFFCKSLRCISECSIVEKAPLWLLSFVISGAVLIAFYYIKIKLMVVADVQSTMYYSATLMGAIAMLGIQQIAFVIGATSFTAYYACKKTSWFQKASELAIIKRIGAVLIPLRFCSIATILYVLASWNIYRSCVLLPPFRSGNVVQLLLLLVVLCVTSVSFYNILHHRFFGERHRVKIWIRRLAFIVSGAVLFLFFSILIPTVDRLGILRGLYHTLKIFVEGMLPHGLFWLQSI